VNEVEKLTRELVKTPSHEDETEAGDLIEDWLRAETDAEVERDAVGNVIGRRGDAETALVGHHDTVPPAEEQVEEGVPTVERRDGRLYGRGTADMKGALAAAMVAFRDTAATDAAFVSFVGEERGGVGARHATGDGFVPERAVVIEGSAGYSSPGSLDVAVAHRGRREVHVETRGEAGHAGEADDSDNPIYGAVDAINRIRRYETSATVEVGGEGFSVEGTATVTAVEGRGERTNVLPSRCEFVVDERTVPDDEGMDYSALDAREEVVDEMPPMRCDNETFARQVRESARSTGASRFVTKPHATDAGHLASAGSSCVVCGPAERGEAHTDDESVSVETLKRAAEVYRGVLERTE